MKYRHKIRPGHMQQRTVRKFLWLPTTLSNNQWVRITRWLEFAVIHQWYSVATSEWVDDRWADLDDYSGAAYA